MDTRDAMRAKLRIRAADVAAVSGFLTAPGNRLVDGLLDLIERYGGVDAINRHAAEAGRLETRLERLREERSPFLADLGWLAEERDAGRFVTLPEYRHGVLGADTTPVDEGNAVTLEISALQYFPWLIAEARQAIARRELMPARYIRVRAMREQSAPGEDILAVAAAMQVIGASHVETLDTRGTDGSNVHLGGPAAITGYFGGIGQPNDHALGWADECLHYLTEFGVREVLNVNSGTILIALLMHKLGIDIAFKVSVFMGVDNPWAVLWLLLGARLLCAEDDSTSMAALNLSNSVEPPTLLEAAEIRRGLGLEDDLRLEHHVTEAYRSIVCQPYDRRADLVAVAAMMSNISAKHEGGEPAVEATREHPSDIVDYFVSKEQAVAGGLMPLLEANYLDKHAAVNRTAAQLVRAGIGLKAAALLHPAVGERSTATA
jgi:hypothetical protein